MACSGPERSTKFILFLFSEKPKATIYVVSTLYKQACIHNRRLSVWQMLFLFVTFLKLFLASTRLRAIINEPMPTRRSKALELNLVQMKPINAADTRRLGVRESPQTAMSRRCPPVKNYFF